MQTLANPVARDLRAVINSPNVQTLLGLCLFEVAYYFAYRYGMSFGKESASPFWFPDSVLLCAFLLSAPGRWWIFVLAALPIRLFVGVPPDVPQWFLLATSAIDFVKGLLGAAILRRLIKNPVRLETVWEFAVFCLFAVLLIPFASAFGGAALRHNLGYAFWPAWEQWFMGDALTQLVVTPAIFYLVIGFPWAMPAPTAKRAVEGGLLTAGLILTGYVALNTSLGGGGFAEPRFYAPVPFLFWAAIRFGMFGACGAITIITVLSVAAALHGRGPFSGQSPADTALALQQFLLLRAAPLYLVAILIEQKKKDEYALHELREDDMRSHQALHESEERVALAAEAANLGVWELNLATNRLWVSDEWRSLFQLGPDEPVSYDEFRKRVHPEDRARWEAAFERAIEENSGYEIEYRVVLPNGTVRWISGRARCLPNAFGLSPRLLGVSADVSQRKQAEEEARRQREQINLLSRVSLLGEMTASLAHELNQPLSAIISNANAGTRFIDGGREDPATLREILVSVVEDGHRAHDIIQNVRNTVKKGDSTRAQH